VIRHLVLGVAAQLARFEGESVRFGYQLSGVRYQVSGINSFLSFSLGFNRVAGCGEQLGTVSTVFLPPIFDFLLLFRWRRVVFRHRWFHESLAAI
jgi:hypothetical protein